MLKKTFKNIFTVGGSDIVTRGIFVLFNVLVARSIVKEEFAIFSLSVTLGVYFWSVVDGGVTAHSIKKVAQSTNDNLTNILGVATSTRLLIAVVFSIVVIVVLLVLPISRYESLVYACSLLYVLAIAIMPAWFSQGRQDNISYCKTYLVVSLAVLLAIACFYIQSLHSDQNALKAIFWRNSFWLFGSCIALIMLVKSQNINLSVSDLIPRINVLTKTYPLGIAAILYSLIPVFPQLYLRMHGLKEELAMYASVWTIQQVLLAGSSVLKRSFLPTLSKNIYFARLTGKVLIIQFVIVLVAACILSLIWLCSGQLVISLLFGERYTTAGNLIPIFAIILVLVFIRGFADTILIVYGQYKGMYKSGIIVIVCMVLFLFFQDKSNISAAWAYLFGEGCLFVVNSYQAYRQVKC